MSYQSTYQLMKHVEIKIKKSTTADTRTCDYTKVSRQQLAESSHQHISDIRQGLLFFCNLLELHGLSHDSDKMTDLDGFFADFQTGFSKKDWLDRHYQKNRHHLENPDAVPPDVNLLDLLDHITDQVLAGMARSGEIRPVDLSNELLQKAVSNTVKLLKDQVVVDNG